VNLLHDFVAASLEAAPETTDHGPDDVGPQLAPDGTEPDSTVPDEVWSSTDWMEQATVLRG
jgi:hypothetical protein